MFRHAFLTVVFAASLCRQATALVIFINPGPVGQINTDFQLDVPELVGLQVDGEEFTLDFATLTPSRWATLGGFFCVPYLHSAWQCADGGLRLVKV